MKMFAVAVALLLCVICPTTNADAEQIDICRNGTHITNEGYLASPCYPSQVPRKDFSCSCTIINNWGTPTLKFSPADIQYCNCCSEQLHINSTDDYIVNSSAICGDRCDRCVTDSFEEFNRLFGNSMLYVHYLRITEQENHCMRTGHLNISFKKASGSNDGDVNITCQGDIPDYPNTGCELPSTTCAPSYTAEFTTEQATTEPSSSSLPTESLTEPIELHSSSTPPLTEITDTSVVTSDDGSLWSTTQATEGSTTTAPMETTDMESEPGGGGLDTRIRIIIVVVAAVVIIIVIVVPITVRKKRNKQEHQDTTPNQNFQESSNENRHPNTNTYITPQSEFVDFSANNFSNQVTSDDTWLIDNTMYGIIDKTNHKEGQNLDRAGVKHAVQGNIKNVGQIENPNHCNGKDVQMAHNVPFKSDDFSGNQANRFSGTELFENSTYGTQVPPLIDGKQVIIDASKNNPVYDYAEVDLQNLEQATLDGQIISTKNTSSQKNSVKVRDPSLNHVPGPDGDLYTMIIKHANPENH